MKFVLIANGLTHRGEHSYRLVHEVQDALTRRGIASQVYAAKSLEPEILAEGIAVPHFEHSLYDNIGPRVTGSWARKLEEWWPQGRCIVSYPVEYLTSLFLNRSFLRDLRALPQNVCAADNLLVVTAICQNQLLGLIAFMLGRARTSLPIVVCQLMFPPNWTPWEAPGRYAEGYYRQALEKAAPLIGDRLFFTTENEFIARIYREQYGLKTRILPVPLALVRSPPVLGKAVRLGFFGYSKSEKGFHLLPEAVDRCRDAGLNVEFHIQVQHSHWEKTTIAAEQKLRAMPNVTLIDGTLSSDDYLAATDKVDVILLPYDPVAFGMRGSGIFTESVAAGRPIVASAGTFAGDCILRGEAQGEVFGPYNAQQFVAAIKRILPRLPKISEQAKAQSETFARRHDGDAYVDSILDMVHLKPDQFTEKKKRA
jgi:glycosyltransferase involved in cell wall biosynthesis